VKLPRAIEAALQEVEQEYAARGEQQAGVPRLRRLRAAIEAALLREPPKIAPSEPEVAALIERAGDWERRLFDHEVAGHTPTPLETDAEPLIRSLLLVLEYSIPREAAAPEARTDV